VISAQLKGRDFLRVNDWDADELISVLDLADRLKARQRERIEHRHLEGRSLGMIFQKPATCNSGAARRSRTREPFSPATSMGS
jgi:ornithine carbamoyltransferase